MTMGLAMVIGLSMGVVFGFVLEKSRVFEPGIIVGQMQLGNFTMLKVFLTAVATGALVLGNMHFFGLITLHPKAAVYGADLVGGLLLGAGIALAGACPGTVLAQIGAGYRDAVFTLVGGLLGAAAFSYLQPLLAHTLLAESGGKILLTDLFGVPYWSGALSLFGFLVIVLIALEIWRPWREDLGTEFDGERPPSSERRTDYAGQTMSEPGGAGPLRTS